MQETKLCQHLLLLTEPMRRRFRLFLASPYFNQTPRLLDLFGVLELAILRGQNELLTEAEAWTAYQGTLPYDQNRLRKDGTSLLQLLMRFLAQSAFDADQPQQALYALQRINAIGGRRFFEGHAELTEEALQTAEDQGKPVFSKRMDLAMERYSHDLGQPGRTSDIQLDRLIDAADLDQIVRKMELLYLALNHRLVTGRGELREDPDLLKAAESRLPELPRRTQMHYHLYLCTHDPRRETHYQAFRQLLKSAHAGEVHLADMYTAALNYCARRLNAGQKEYLLESHTLHREMVDRTLIETDRVSGFLKNAVVVACRLREFPWASSLLQHFDAHMKASGLINSLHYCHGLIAYHEGMLDKAESHFYRVLDGAEDIYYELGARAYLLQIFYTNHNTISLDALLSSYRMFVKRNAQALGDRRTRHLSYLKFMHRLSRIARHDRPALQRLHDDILKAEPFAPTDWLIHQIESQLS